MKTKRWKAITFALLAMAIFFFASAYFVVKNADDSPIKSYGFFVLNQDNLSTLYILNDEKTIMYMLRDDPSHTVHQSIVPSGLLGSIAERAASDIEVSVTVEPPEMPSI